MTLLLIDLNKNGHEKYVSPYYLSSRHRIIGSMQTRKDTIISLKPIIDKEINNTILNKICNIIRKLKGFDK